MSQRQRATTQGVPPQVAWQGMPWQQVQRQVFCRQQRMSRATQRGEVSTVHKLQKVLGKSGYARRLAVRRMTQDNQGTHPTGIAGAKSLPPPQRWRLVNELRLDGTARARRRLWMPTRGSVTAKRPLGMPTQADRARSTRVRQALEPAWEAKVSSYTSGFRPGRSGHDAIGAICTARRSRPPCALKLDSATCFETIAQQALWATGQAPPLMRRPRKAWLQAGILANDSCSPTIAGTPQGGSGSPLLALIALHGLEEAITQVSPHARVIAYAEDGVVLHEERQVLEHGQALRKTWLAQMGLRWHEAKSSLRPTVEGEQPGCEFLGVAIRQYRVGKHQSGKGPGGWRRLGDKTLLTPAQGQVQDHVAELGRLITRGRALPQGLLIRQLHPKIQGWATDYRTGVSQAVDDRLEHLPRSTLRSWARWRHPRTSIGWVTRRSWQRLGARLTCATSELYSKASLRRCAPGHWSVTWSPSSRSVSYGMHQADKDQRQQWCYGPDQKHGPGAVRRHQG